MADMKSNVWSAGTVINGYTMLTDAHVGEMAFSGKAQSPTGQIVFFKQYKNPSATLTPWYKEYVAYQKEIKHRIEAVSKIDSSGRNQGPTYRLLEFFEDIQKRMDPKTMQKKDTPVFCQVMEYVDGAKDLKTYLASSETTWEQRKKFASAFLFAMNKLHSECGIVHTDLKPENVLLLPVVTKNGSQDFQIKVINLDFSILKDKQAPWHGLDRYIGTPGYFSPEHLNGKVPTEKSDAFTCGLILYEILSEDGHPYAGEENGDILVYKPYDAYPAPLPKLRGSYGSPEKDAQVAQMLQRMLDLDPENRPSVLEVQRLLIKR